jgi:hypothetical protein
MDEVEKAEEMLDLFESVGVKAFDVTITDIDGKKLAKGGFVSQWPIEQLRPALGPVLRETTAHQHNFIIRPVVSDRDGLIQLDDLTQEQAAKFNYFAFMTLRTSPGNYQVWVAVKDPEDGFARRLKKGAGADPSASGATRISGSRNFKRKYEPDFPLVEIDDANPDLKMTRAQLEQAGLVAPKVRPQDEVKQEIRANVDRIKSDRARAAARGWPSYQKCLEGAPPVHGGEDRPDISKADFTFCMIAVDWGHAHPDIFRRLKELSPKAKENGDMYVARTIQNAAAAVERNRREAGR